MALRMTLGALPLWAGNGKLWTGRPPRGEHPERVGRLSDERGFEKIFMSRYAGITVDTKRRWALPQMFRHELAKAETADGTWAFYIGYEEDGCLYLLTPDQYATYAAELDRLFDDGDPEDRATRTQILGNFQRVHTDNANRLTIPEEHAEIAGLSGKIDLVTGDRRSEIWHSDALRRRRADGRQPALDRLADRRGKKTATRSLTTGSAGEGS